MRLRRKTDHKQVGAHFSMKWACERASLHIERMPSLILCYLGNDNAPLVAITGVATTHREGP
jgi:hypothetical protein